MSNFLHDIASACAGARPRIQAEQETGPLEFSVHGISSIDTRSLDGRWRDENTSWWRKIVTACCGSVDEGHLEVDLRSDATSRQEPARNSHGQPPKVRHVALTSPKRQESVGCAPTLVLGWKARADPAADGRGREERPVYASPLFPAVPATEGRRAEGNTSMMGVKLTPIQRLPSSGGAASAAVLAANTFARGARHDPSPSNRHPGTIGTTSEVTEFDALDVRSFKSR